MSHEEKAAVSPEGVGKREGNRSAVSKAVGRTLWASPAVVRTWLLIRVMGAREEGPGGGI